MSQTDRAAFIDFIRQQTRFEIGGRVADEGIVRRLAAILETHQAWDRFRVRVREWSRNHEAYGWGIMIWLAEESIVKRPEPAQQTELEFNVRSISEAKRMPVGRSPKVDERVKVAIQAATNWRKP